MEDFKFRYFELETAFAGVIAENESLKRQLDDSQQHLLHEHRRVLESTSTSPSRISCLAQPLSCARIQELATADDPTIAELSALALRANRLEMVVAGAKLGIWDWNTQTNEVVFNKHWKAMLGYEEHELENNLETWKRLMHPDDYDWVIAELTQHLEGKTTVYSTEHRVAHKDGHWVWILDTGKVVQWDAEGKPLRATGIHQDISWRKQLEQELITALDVAQGANKAKSAFLANMSHEIRTPMAGILGAGTLLMESPLDPDQEELAGMIVESTKLLLSIVNDILDLSKIEEGYLKVENIPMDLDETLLHVNKLFWLKAHEKGIVLQVKPPENGRHWIKCDPTRLREILLNLVGNAIKFTHKGKVVVTTELEPCATSTSPRAPRSQRRSTSPAHTDACSCRCCAVAGCCLESARACTPDGTMDYESPWDLLIHITDTGIGMSPDMVEHVFDRFQQADSSTARIYGGSGLGTTISKKLAKLMGGDLRVESEKGKGSTFTLHLPVKLAMPAPVTTVNKNEEDLARNYGLTAILAEDNDLNRRILQKMFASLGVRTIPANNGVAVLNCVKESPDHVLIFMDIQMPVCDGITATKTLRSNGYGRPIVALTANAMQSDRESYIAAGMNGTLPKPFTKALICAEIDRLIANRILVKASEYPTGENMVTSNSWWMIQRPANGSSSSLRWLEKGPGLAKAPPAIPRIDWPHGSGRSEFVLP
eukprot:jgi/Mesvir1/26316/Mv22497-RA.1